MKLNERVQRVFKLTILLSFVFILLIIQPMTVFAFNSDYLQLEKWGDSKNVTAIYLDKESSGGELEGFFKYYINGNEGSIYTYFSITETSLNSQNNDVRIQYSITSSSENYDFAIDAAGICDAMENEISIFDTYANFSYHPNSDTGTYLSAVQFDNLDEKFVDISLFVNGHIYRNIVRNMHVYVQPESKSTAIAERTKGSSSKQSSNKNSDKTNAGNAVNGKNSNADTTKFSQNRIFSDGSSQNSEYQSEPEQHSEQNEIIDGTEIYAQQSDTAGTGRSQMTDFARVTVVIAGIFGAAGLVLISAGVFTKKKENSEK